MCANKIDFLTGTAIPVGALKTSNSCGVGEFLDLIPFADFCKKAGLKLIQLLPVNDTGTESSPYSALSAFALHPLYISLKSLPEVEGKEEILAEITKLQKNTKNYLDSHIVNCEERNWTFFKRFSIQKKIKFFQVTN